MSSSQENPGGAGTAAAVVVEDLILTDSFLVKGTVEGKFGRLSQLLDKLDRRFIAMRNATVVDLRGEEVIRTPRIQINVREVVLAHELVDAGSDYFQKNLAKDRKEIRIRAFFSGAFNLEVSGLIRPGAYENGDPFTKRFFVMEEPKLRGFEFDAHPELMILSKLTYGIMHKDRISYLYDFS